MIYYVEDDTNVRDLALYTLRQAGLEAEGFAEASSFREACDNRLPDLVLLDIMLPTTDGLTLLRELRSSALTSNIPIMMLTAKGTEYDKVLGLDSGADDYLCKPFGMMELVSRCNALLRRAKRSGSGTANNRLTCGLLVLDPLAHEAFVGDMRIELTLKEFALLEKLMGHPGRAFTRPQLLEDIWGITLVGETRTVDTHIQTLRRKLEDAYPGASNMIETVRGVGYRLSREH